MSHTPKNTIPNFPISKITKISRLQIRNFWDKNPKILGFDSPENFYLIATSASKFEVQTVCFWTPDIFRLLKKKSDFKNLFEILTLLLLTFIIQFLLKFWFLRQISRVTKNILVLLIKPFPLFLPKKLFLLTKHLFNRLENP